MLKESNPSAKVVMLIEEYDLKQVIAAFQAGADAYLKKSISHEVLVKSLDLVMLGEAIFPGAILELLRERELCVCDLREAMGISPSKLSFHLKTLKEAQLVKAKQEGRWIYYSLNLPQFVVLEQYLAEFRRYSPILPTRTCRDE